MAGISAKIVKELRDQTGAGMMDCKKALTETDGDVSKAVEWLRQKGISSAEKKSGKVAAEGLVGQYIHTGGRVGVLVEVNCQTDFVARNDAFQELVRNVAMQIAACPNVEFISTDEIPESVVEREREIEKGREDLASKPENIRERIVDGRIGKRLGELALMNQPYIRDQSITVEDLVKQTSGELGEKIEVRRFARFVLGEGIEKKEDDFAAEVAAQAAAAKAKAEQAEAKEDVKEEPKTEEPKTEEPKAEEPKVEEPKVEEPKAEEPKVEEPQAEEPKAEEPQAEKPQAKASKGGFGKKSGKKKGGSKKKGLGK